MKYECTITPEMWVDNHYYNLKGGEFGCPIDRALFAAGVPMAKDETGRGSYAGRGNEGIRYQMGGDDGTIDKVIEIHHKMIPMQEIKFTVEI